jgi:hypothetical protein
MRHLGSALVLTILLVASGCAGPDGFSGIREVEYKLIDVETVTDPQTGEIVKLSHWRYDDGVEVTTKDRFAKETRVEDRRATSRPGLRLADAP